MAITVKQLIQKLKKLPQDLLVLADGCDCWGHADDAKVVKAGGGWGDVDTVLIVREENNRG